MSDDLIKRLRDELLDYRPCDHDCADFVSENIWCCLICDNTLAGARYAQDLEDSKRIAAVIAEADTYLAVAELGESEAKDAARYQWLKSRLPRSAYRINGMIYFEGGAGFDAAIDEAMQKESGK